MQPALYRDLSHFDPTLPSYSSTSSTLARFRALLEEARTGASRLVRAGIASREHLRLVVMLEAQHGEAAAEIYARRERADLWQNLPNDIGYQG